MAATTSGIRSQDWSSVSRNAGLYGPDVPPEGLWYEKVTGSAPATVTPTSTCSSGRAAER